MDPNTILELIDSARKLKRQRQVDEYIAVLRAWLNRGGFAPNYSRYPRTTAMLKRRGVIA